MSAFLGSREHATTEITGAPLPLANIFNGHEPQAERAGAPVSQASCQATFTPLIRIRQGTINRATIAARKLYNGGEDPD
jgi:hypothetical protein